MRKLTALVIAITGLFVLGEAFTLMLSPISLSLIDFPGGKQPLAVALASIPALTCVALAVYLIFARDRIAMWYLAGSDDALSISAESLLRAGLVLIGIYLVAQAIPALVTLVGSPLAGWLQMRADPAYAQLETADASLWRWFVQVIPTALSALTSLAVGCVLLAKREAVVSRVLGTVPVPVGVEDTSPAHCPSCGAGYDPSDYDGQFGEPQCQVCKQPLDIPRT